MKPNRKTTTLTLTALVLAGQLSAPAAALAQSLPVSGDVHIADAFPDQAFRTWLLNGKNLDGAGADGILTEEERLAVKSLNLSGLGLTSLEGLEAFPNL